MLVSLGIPSELGWEGREFFIAVPEEHAARAAREIAAYEAENRQPIQRAPAIEPVFQDSLPGVAGYIAVISVVAVLAGEAVFNRDWFAAGRVDGVLIRDGQWWRTITALTLHSGLPHYFGNLVFGSFFGVLAGRVLGSGVTWFAVVVAAALANFLNTILLDSTHRSIGASTAVFAALGLVAGFAWRAKLFAQDRWAYRLGPVIAGVALLAYTGTGDENTDIGAHLAGFATGFAGGVLLTLVYRYLPAPQVQKLAGFGAVALIVIAWLTAL